MVARSSTPSNWRALLTRPEVLVGSEVSTMLLVPRFPVFPLPLESVRVWPEVSSNFQLAMGPTAVGALTVKLKLVVWVTPPPVPVTVMVEVPVGVDVEVEMVRPVEQAGEHAVDENAAVAPEGNPAAEKETDCVVPETSAALMVLETEVPCVTDLLPPLLSEKSNDVDAGFTVKLKLVVLVTPPPVPVTVRV